MGRLLGVFHDILENLTVPRARKGGNDAEVSALAKRSKAAEYRRLKKSLEENLSARGLVEDVFRDKLGEYLALWKKFQELDQDIETRGVTVFDERRGMLVENRSVSLAVQVSRQMLSIYDALGFKEQAKSAVPSGGEDDEL